MASFSFVALFAVFGISSVRGANELNTTACPLGFGQHPLLGACAQCPAGTFGNGGVWCDACSPGHYSGVGASACSLCEGGAWSAARAAGCHACPDGYQATADATQCVGCEAGSFSAGGAACAVCAVGLWSPIHSGSCFSCPSGQWQGLRVHPDVEACRSMAADGIGLLLAGISACAILSVTWWIAQEFRIPGDRTQRMMRVKFLLNVWVAVLDQLSDSLYFLFYSLYFPPMLVGECPSFC
jgi:hypothetical protein